MIFSDNKSIYLQICDYLCEQIVSKEYSNEDKIPSVRDLAMDLEVNTNTVVKAYEQLTVWEIIYTKRGLGYFVASKGFSNAKKRLKQEFIEEMMPQVFNRIQLLDISFEELQTKFTQFQNKQKK